MAIEPMLSALSAFPHPRPTSALTECREANQSQEKHPLAHYGKTPPGLYDVPFGGGARLVAQGANKAKQEKAQ